MINYNNVGTPIMTQYILKNMLIKCELKLINNILNITL